MKKGRKIMEVKYVLFGASVLAMMASPSAFAQSSQSGAEPGTSDQQEIIVTAQRREERLQDVPITIQNISGQQLRDANVQQLTDISKITPALKFNVNASFVQPTIRGIGSAIVTSGSGSNVGIYT